MVRGRNPILQTFALVFLAAYLGPVLAPGTSALLHDVHHAGRLVANLLHAHGHHGTEGHGHGHAAPSGSRYAHVHRAGGEPHSHSPVVDLLRSAAPHGEDRYERFELRPPGLDLYSSHLPEPAESLRAPGSVVDTASPDAAPSVAGAGCAPPTPPPRV